MNLIGRCSLVGFGLIALLGSKHAAAAAPVLVLPSFRKYVVEAIDKPALYQFVLRGRVQLYLDYFPNGLLALRDEKLEQHIVRFPLKPITIGQVHFMLSKKVSARSSCSSWIWRWLPCCRDGSVRKLQYKYGVMPE